MKHKNSERLLFVSMTQKNLVVFGQKGRTCIHDREDTLKASMETSERRE